MDTSATRTPLGLRLPWLLRWDGSRQAEGLACLFPDCLKVVYRKPSAPGAPRWYCERHGRAAATRRQQLLEEIARISHILESTPAYTRGIDRKGLVSDLQYLHVALAAYPDPDTLYGERRAAPNVGSKPVAAPVW